MSRSYAGRSVVGLVVLIAIAVVGWFGTRFAQGAFDETYRVHITIGESGQGVISGSDEVARGVIVGEVGEISLDDQRRAVVELVLEPRYTVPSDAVFAVTGKTLLGEKQVEILFDGPFDAPDALADGGVVDDPSRVVELQDVLSELDGLLGAIDPADLAVLVDDGLGSFDGQGAAIGRAVDQGARATDVFARSLDDQVPSLRDLSLVAEALGPVGDELNRLGSVIDGGALGTVTDNQVRLRGLLGSLSAFGDQLDVVLSLTRPDLDRLIVQGDNVTRLFFTYRPELADFIEGLDGYANLFAEIGVEHPGWTGPAVPFQIQIDPGGGGEDPAAQFCAEVPPELAEVLPVCSGQPAPDGGGDGPAPPPLPVVEVPVLTSTSPATTESGGLERILDGLMAPR